MPHCSIICHAIPYHYIRYDAISYHTTQYHYTVPFHTITHHNNIPHHTINFAKKAGLLYRNARRCLHLSCFPYRHRRYCCFCCCTISLLANHIMPCRTTLPYRIMYTL